MAVRRSDGRWQASVRWAGAGKPRRYTFYGSSRADADAQAHAFRQRVQGHAGLLLQEWLQEWLLRPGRAASTQECYSRLAARWLTPLYRWPLTALSVRDVQQAVDAAPTGTRRKLLAIIRACLNDAVREGLLAQNPALLVRVPGYTSKGMPLSHADAAAVLAHAGRYRPLFRIALGTGLRHGELLALTPADVQAGQLVIRQSKTKAGIRNVPVPTELHACLYELASTDLLFTNTRQQPLTTTHVRQRLHAACDAAGVQRRRVHDLRHTYATWLLQAGVQLHVVSKLLGHSSLAVTADVYGHAVPSSADVSVLNGLV